MGLNENQLHVYVLCMSDIIYICTFFLICYTSHNDVLPDVALDDELVSDGEDDSGDVYNNDNLRDMLTENCWYS